jgi:hypothetical protein
MAYHSPTVANSQVLVEFDLSIPLDIQHVAWPIRIRGQHGDLASIMSKVKTELIDRFDRSAITNGRIKRR